MSTDNSPALGTQSPAVPEELVQAAIRAGAHLGMDVADVPVIAIAREAGISRSTLIRRLGGTRVALDDAVRANGIDPGGRAPVRTRALDSAAELLSTTGLGAATLEAIATRAQCSVHSLYAVFGGRDELLRALFERHSALLDIEDAFDTAPDADLSATVHRIYRIIAQSLGREPRVAPAMLAEALARPDSPAIQNLLVHSAPRLLGSLGAWLAGEVQAQRLRDIPLVLLMQLLITPISMHMLVRPAVSDIPGVELPDIDTVCETFAEAFLRAAATTTPPSAQRRKS